MERAWHAELTARVVVSRLRTGRGKQVSAALQHLPPTESDVPQDPPCRTVLTLFRAERNELRETFRFLLLYAPSAKFRLGENRRMLGSQRLGRVWNT